MRSGWTEKEEWYNDAWEYSLEPRNNKQTGKQEEKEEEKKIWSRIEAKKKYSLKSLSNDKNAIKHKGRNFT